jgi:Cu(I)/Ag(I) efflux system membrane fusion protein
MRALQAMAAMAVAIGVGSCAGSRSDPVSVRSAGIELAVAAEPAELRVGANTLWLELRDAAGEPLAGADVEVDVSMHAMGAMPAMGGPARVTEIGGGRYRADFALEMGSTWSVAIAARPPGGALARAEGSLTVGTRGLRLESADAPSEHAAHRDSAVPPAGSGEAPHPAEFRVPPGRLQRIGVKTGIVERRRLVTQVRTVGRVTSEQSALADVALKISGWVGEIAVDAIGAPVERGEVLFRVYSPELYAAQEEYLQALRSQARARATGAPDRADYLVRAARNRLRLWDLAPADLERLAAGDTPLEQLPIRSPVTGYVVEKNVVSGSAFGAGERLYRIAPLARVWIEAEVYESDLPLVREGQPAVVTLPYLPDRRLEATVAYVYPELDPETRTARLRLELPNPDLALRPGMYADVRLQADRGERLVVPQSAVLYAGQHSYVFRALGDGRFRPQAVAVGMRSGEEVEILEGIEAGEAIVTSATFLIASESRLRAALDQW